MKINIIGAGVAGLCTGSYLQMNGYDTAIFELGDTPGGLCTAWDRKGYRFDGCVHWLMGASPANSLYRHWNELIDMKQLDMVFSDVFFTIEDGAGNRIDFYKDVDRLEKELLEKASEDETEIRKFTEAVRRLAKVDITHEKTPEVMTIWDGLGMGARFFSVMPLFKRWGSITLETWARRFRNPLLRAAIHNAFVPNMAAIFLLFTLADMHRKGSGYPVGGSIHFSRLLEKRYLDLGGKINYKARVKKILTEIRGGRSVATGIELDNGEMHLSDVVVSAADGHSTIFEMLDGRFANDKIRSDYRDLAVFSSFLQVSFGVNRQFDEAPEGLMISLDEPLQIDPETTANVVAFRIFNYDPTMAPEGKTSITVTLQTFNHQYWIALRKDDRNAYKKEKQRLSDAVAEILERRFPGIKEKIEVTDVSTPATVVRYTNNWKGSFEGWVMTPEMGFRQMKKQLPGLDNFYMVGQWVSPGGGLPSGLITGRGLAQILCKRDKKKFRTEKF